MKFGEQCFKDMYGNEVITNPLEHLKCKTAMDLKLLFSRDEILNALTSFFVKNLQEKSTDWNRKHFMLQQAGLQMCHYSEIQKPVCSEPAYICYKDVKAMSGGGD